MGISGHVLIVDDEAVLRQTLAHILKKAGFDATTAADGKEGLFHFSQQTFDLVYLDIRLPDMSGLEVLRAIRSQNPDVPVILFTAQPDLKSALEALHNGAMDYLLKPLKPETIIERTRTILAGLERERRKRELRMRIEALQAELRALESNNEEAQGEMAAITVNANERFLTRGKLTLDLHTRRLLLGGRTVHLPPTTFDYLLVLTRHAPNLVDYQTLVSEAQGYRAEAREAQELAKWHVHHIRQAIEPAVQLINVRGSGYRLVVD